MTTHYSIIVTNILPTGSAFAVREDTGEQAFIPAAVSKATDLKIGMIAQAMLVPNRHDSADVPWMAPVIVPSETAIETPDEVFRKLDCFDYPVTADEAEVSLFSLQSAHAAGKVVKLIVKESPEAKAMLYWAATIDKV
jgi:hypothetical protein